MPRYLVQRTFPQGLRIPMTADGAKACAKVVANNAEDGVTWVHSYVSEDRCKTFCIYDGPSVDAVHAAARRSSMSVEGIQPVTVLDPYFYRS
ncbi:MAG TPA: DUF4242 domain-containing protein [Caldimonas sp.]|jgi:hypothetical protein